MSREDRRWSDDDEQAANAALTAADGGPVAFTMTSGHHVRIYRDEAATVVPLDSSPLDRLFATNRGHGHDRSSAYSDPSTGMIQ